MSEVMITPEVELTKAVAAAKDFLLGLEKQNLVASPIKNLVLEEVNWTNAGNWLITLGYRTPTPLDETMTAAGAALAGLRTPRSEVFKVFTVDGRSGEVLGMRIREPRAD